MEQTGLKRLKSGIAGAAAAVILLGLAGISAMTGPAPFTGTPPAQRTQSAEKAVEPARSPGSERSTGTQPCATCGTVESVRALAGNETGKQTDRKTVYHVTIRMDDGSYRTISEPVAPGYSVGEKVRIIESAIVARG